MHNFRSVSGIIRAAKNAGSHFFDSDTMSFFDSVVYSDPVRILAPGDVLFITSEQFSRDDTREYRVRRAHYTPAGNFTIDTVSPRPLPDLASAMQALRAFTPEVS